jgi:hypothetical protein
MEDQGKLRQHGRCPVGDALAVQCEERQHGHCPVGEPPADQRGHCPLGQCGARATQLGRTSVQRLVACGAPFLLVQMALYMADRVGQRGRTLDLVEMFSGEGMLSKSFQEAGCTVASYEIDKDPVMCDLTTDIGMLHAVGLVLRLKVGGLLWGGVPCSSWVWVNRATSRRTQNCPLGNPKEPSVRRANLLVVRWTLLVLLAVSRGCLWLCEQPMSSLMPEHPRLRRVQELCPEPKFSSLLKHSVALPACTAC